MDRCIYALVDPRDDAIRYIGASVDPVKRLESHLRDKEGNRKCGWLSELKNLGLTPRLIEIEIASESEWEEAERWWIAECRAVGCDLTNHTDGGLGLINPTADTREKMSRIQSERMRDPEYRAKVFTDERNNNVSKSLTGVPKSKDHVSKLWQNQKGYKLRPERAEQCARFLMAARHLIPRQTDLHPNARAALAKANAGNQHTKGRVQSDDERLQRSLAIQGIPKSNEHKQRISDGMKAAWALRQDDRQRRVEASKIEWPSYESIEQRLRSRTIKQLADELGVKPGTLSAFLWRHRRNTEVMQENADGKSGFASEQ